MASALSYADTPMQPLSNEDTMICSRPRRSDAELDSDEIELGADGQPLRANMLTRTRALFRVVGERMSSFELSRQIYG